MTIQIAHSPPKYPATQHLPAVLPARTARGGLVGACTPPNSFFVLRRLPSPIHACAYIPAGTARCFVSPRPEPPSIFPFRRWIGSRVQCFEARSALTVAGMPHAVLRHRSASGHVVTSMSHPGSCQPKTAIVGQDSHPHGKRILPRRTEEILYRTPMD